MLTSIKDKDNREMVNKEETEIITGMLHGMQRHSNKYLDL